MMLYMYGLPFVMALRKALETTPELLPVLKKAGVADAGGNTAIMLYLVDGLASVRFQR